MRSLHGHGEQARAARATLLSRQLSPAEDVVFHDEQMASLLHERFQHAPPIYDHLSRVSTSAAFTLLQFFLLHVLRGCSTLQGTPQSALRRSHPLACRYES